MFVLIVVSVSLDKIFVDFINGFDECFNDFFFGVDVFDVFGGYFFDLFDEVVISLVEWFNEGVMVI